MPDTVERIDAELTVTVTRRHKTLAELSKRGMPLDEKKILTARLEVIDQRIDTLLNERSQLTLLEELSRL